MNGDCHHVPPEQQPYPLLEAEALRALEDTMDRTGAVHVQSRSHFRDVFRRNFAARLNPDAARNAVE